MSIFEKAKSSISSGIVRQIVVEIDSTAKPSGEAWLLKCPFHDDQHASFLINIEKGYFNCQSCGAKGDFIDLIVQRYNLGKKQAAEKIVQMAGGNIIEFQAPKKHKMPAPIIPIPCSEEIKKALNFRLQGDWSIGKYGRAVAGWRYHDAEGNVLWIKVRHEKGKGKDVLPYYWGEDNQWHSGHPMPNNRPLYNLHKLPKDADKILIVEGEKCAEVEVLGYFLMTWDGGTSTVKKADWSVLENHPAKIVIWPDLDRQKDRGGKESAPGKQPGMKAALYIKGLFPDARLLDVYGAQDADDKTDGWDIFDAVAEGIDPVAYIDSCSEFEVKPPAPEKEPQYRTEYSGITFPFECLGYDESQYIFLQEEVNYPIRYRRGGLSKNNMIDLADLAFWEYHYPTRHGGVHWDTATNDIYRAQQSVGYFDENHLRGAGFWKDGKQIILNTGRNIIMPDGNPVEYKDFQTEYNYIFSQNVKMSDWTGEISTDIQGKLLKNLFHVQHFENILQAYVVLGWSLIAPFGGLLDWRPHIWISGSAQSGKSWIVENLISKLIGAAALYGSGGASGSTVAATRRSLGQDVRPVVYDEMEPKTMDSRRKITEIVEMARNASSNASSESRLVNKNGGVDIYRIRSPFCFASVVPFFDDRASQSRFIVCNVSGRKMEEKIERTQDYIKRGILNDPGLYRRRIFHQIDDVMANIEKLRSKYFIYFSDRRKADMLAPIFAIIYALDHTGRVSSTWIEESKKCLVNDIDAAAPRDEDTLFNEIMEIQIRLNPSQTKTVSEILTAEAGPEDNKEELERIGIKLVMGQDGIVKLAIAKHSRHLRRELQNTPYANNYSSVLKRHDFYIKTRSERMAGKSVDSILLDFGEITLQWAKEVDPDVPF